AARHLTIAVADVFRAVLQSIVAFLLTKGMSAAQARLGELVRKLRSSKLGEDFGNWVERSWKRIIENPKLKPKEIENDGTSKNGTADAPPRARETTPKPKTKPKNLPITSSRLQATNDGALHNQSWKQVKVEKFEAK